jgi:hypothetical protein
MAADFATDHLLRLGQHSQPLNVGFGMRCCHRRLLVLVSFSLFLGLSGCGKGNRARLPDFGSPPKPDAAQITKARDQLWPAGAPPLVSTSSPLMTTPLAREWGVRETAIDALARIGPAAIPSLIVALEDPNADVRDRAAQSLARMGPPAKEAVPMLIAALEDPDWSVRRSAARALGQIGPEAAPAVPALMQLLKSPDAEQGGPGVVRPSAGI